VSLNGQVAGTYTSSGTCDCAASAVPQQVVTLTAASLSAYVAGGTNTFLIGAGPCNAGILGCFGATVAGSTTEGLGLLTPTQYAKVSVSP
jgi:hypothetical protein